MKTLLNKTKAIEDQIFKKALPEDNLLFEANLILDSDLEETVLWQQKTYEIINEYGRQKIKEEIEAVHQKIFTHSRYQSFRERIFQLFIKNHPDNYKDEFME